MRAVRQRHQPTGGTPTALAAQFGQIPVRAAVAALPACCDGAQPQLLWRGRRRQWPGVRPISEGRIGQCPFSDCTVMGFNHGTHRPIVTYVIRENYVVFVLPTYYPQPHATHLI